MTTRPTFSGITTGRISPNHYKGSLTHFSMFNRRMMQRLRLSLIMLALFSSQVFAHARLTASSPTSNSVVTDSLREVRLVFSAPVEVAMCRIMLISGSLHIPLTPRGDPKNSNIVLADMESLAAGDYQLKWNVLSADGHALSGTIPFTVTTPISSSRPLPPVARSEEAIEMKGPESSSLLGLAMFLRGLGMTALMAFAGLLFFGAGASSELTGRFNRLASTLGATASVALLIHFLVWISVSSAELPGPASISRALQTSAGMREGTRVVLAVFAFCAWMFTGKTRVALFASLAAVVAGAFVGHAAAVSPAVSISFKSAHLAAGAIWLGGLAWLLNLASDNSDHFTGEAAKVSRAAGFCAFLVLISGIVQAGIVLSWKPDALTSSYGIVAALKLIGAAVLISIGAYNRFKLVPNLGNAVGAGTLQKTVGREIWIMILVAMLGGVLAYLSPPEAR
jgi:copper transport protein